MKSDVGKSEIDALEELLNDFKSEWSDSQNRRAKKWRINFFISFVIILLLSFIAPVFGWLGLAIIAYFAGSLFTMLRQNAKTTYQIFEHQEQLRLVRLLRKFKASPYSEK